MLYTACILRASCVHPVYKQTCGMTRVYALCAGHGGEPGGRYPGERSRYHCSPRPGPPRFQRRLGRSLSLSLSLSLFRSLARSLALSRSLFLHVLRINVSGCNTGDMHTSPRRAYACMCICMCVLSFCLPVCMCVLSLCLSGPMLHLRRVRGLFVGWLHVSCVSLRVHAFSCMSTCT